MGCDVCISHEHVPGALNQQKPLKTVAAMMVLQLNLILSRIEVESRDWKESSKAREASQDEKFLFMKKKWKTNKFREFNVNKDNVAPFPGKKWTQTNRPQNKCSFSSLLISGYSFGHDPTEILMASRRRQQQLFKIFPREKRNLSRIGSHQIYSPSIVFWHRHRSRPTPTTVQGKSLSQLPPDK